METPLEDSSTNYNVIYLVALRINKQESPPTLVVG